MLKVIQTISFWNDEDGFSITDFISVIVISAYVIGIIVCFMYIIFSENVDQTSFNNLKSLLDLFDLPISIILTGYFGNGILNVLKKKIK